MGLRIEHRAREILKGLQQLQGDFGTFRDTFDLGLKHLRNAQVNFGDADRRAEKLAEKIQQFASVAEDKSDGEALPPGAVPAADRFRTRGLEQ